MNASRDSLALKSAVEDDMACMTHECRNCGHAEFNNGQPPERCPKCGELRFYSTIDESEVSEPADSEIADELEAA